MESVTCLSSCSVVLRYLVSGVGAIHGEFPLRPLITECRRRNNADCVERDNRSSNKRKPVKKEEAREHYPLIPPGLTPNSSLKHLLK